MTYKFGDKVLVINEGFYINAKGTVIYYNEMEAKYRVQLEYGIVREFYPEELKKQRGKK